SPTGPGRSRRLVQKQVVDGDGDSTGLIERNLARMSNRRTLCEPANAMSDPSSSTSSERKFAATELLLNTVRGCGTHGQLIDVRESLRSVLGPARPLVILCPHADDGAITAACLLHEYSVRRGLPVIEVLVFAGERNVAAPWLNHQKKVTVREA